MRQRLYSSFSSPPATSEAPVLRAGDDFLLEFLRQVAEVVAVTGQADNEVAMEQCVGEPAFHRFPVRFEWRRVHSNEWTV